MSRALIFFTAIILIFTAGLVRTTDPLLDLEDECGAAEDKGQCFDFSNSEIIKFLEERAYNKTRVARQLNNWIAKARYNKSAIEIFPKDNGFGIRTLTNLTHRQKILGLLKKEALCSNSPLNLMLFTKPFPPPELELEFKLPNFDNSEDQVIFQFLIHFYNRNISALETYFYSLPSRVEGMLFKASKYELDTFFKKEEIKELVESAREIFINKHRIFNSYISLFLNESTFRAIMNTEEIKLEDYIYAHFLLESRGITLNKDIKCLVPALDLVSETQFILERRMRESFNYITTDDYFINFLSPINFSPGEELTVRKGPMYNVHYALLKGYIPKENNNECIDFLLFNQMEARNFLSPNNWNDDCINKFELRRRISYANMHFFTINQFNQKLLSDCIQTYELEKFHDSDSLPIATLQYCDFPIWNDVYYDNRFEELGKFVENAMDEIRISLRKAQEYKKIRVQHNKSLQNADLILTYYEKRMEMLEDLLSEYRMIYPRYSLSNKRWKVTTKSDL